MVRLLTLLLAASPAPQTCRVRTLFLPQGPTWVEPPGMMCCSGTAFEGVHVAAVRCPPRRGDWRGVTGKQKPMLRLAVWLLGRKVPDWAEPLDDNKDGRFDLYDFARMAWSGEGELGR